MDKFPLRGKAQMSDRYWGIDLGGTKMEGTVLTSASAPDPLCRIRIPTEADGGYEHILARIHGLIEQMGSAATSTSSRASTG